MPLLVTFAFGLLGLAWAITNPAFAAPDEAAHYLRAVGISSGHLVGTPARDANPALTTKQRAWSDQAARAVSVPPGLTPGGRAPCMSGQPGTSAACSVQVTRSRTTSREVTSVGTYQPLPYLLPAAVLRAADNAERSNRLGRLATLALWWALLSAATWLLWDAAAGAVSLLGLLVAVTPQAVFVGSSLTGSSLEIAASIAFLAALLRVAREPERPPPAAWVVVGLAGAALALSRSPGPVWVALDVVVWTALAGRATLMRVWRAHARSATLAGATVLVGIGLNRWWEARYGPRVEAAARPPWESLKAGRRVLVDAADELVGNFGYLDTPLGAAGVATWAVLAGAVVAWGLVVAHGRQRWALLLAVAVAVLGPIYLFAAVTRFTGFGLQGRHVLAIVATVPLVAGEVIRRRAAFRPVPWTRPAVAVVAAGVGVVQVLAWWVNARRYAVGTDGPWWFLGQPAWSPPGGWWPWGVMVTCSGAALALSPWVAASPRTGRRRSRSRASSAPGP